MILHNEDADGDIAMMLLGRQGGEHEDIFIDDPEEEDEDEEE